MDYAVIKLRENFWSIDQQGVRAFLLVGAENAILVDTCFGGDIKAVCDTLTDKPITLITTHSDPDHIGCDSQFEKHYLHEAEMPRYAAKTQNRIQALPLTEGDTFSVGDYTLEVILIPGHTPGSIALLDRKHKFLLSGDTVQADCIYMYGDGRDLKAFRESIEKLEAIYQEGAFDTVYASHGEIPLPADILADHRILADEILNGTAIPLGPAPEWFPDTVKTYGWGRARMYY